MSTILIIEDEKEFREMMQMMLEREGYGVVSAEDGDVGMKLLETNDIDLVITDIFMPNKEGVETIMQMLDSYANMKIIAISGGAANLSAVRSLTMAKGMSNVVQTFVKPFLKEDLLAGVRAALKLTI